MLGTKELEGKQLFNIWTASYNRNECVLLMNGSFVASGGKKFWKKLIWFWHPKDADYVIFNWLVGQSILCIYHTLCVAQSPLLEEMGSYIKERERKKLGDVIDFYLSYFLHEAVASYASVLKFGNNSCGRLCTAD